MNNGHEFLEEIKVLTVLISQYAAQGLQGSKIETTIVSIPKTQAGSVYGYVVQPGYRHVYRPCRCGIAYCSFTSPVEICAQRL